LNRLRFCPTTKALLLALAMLSGTLYARGMSEEYNQLKDWQLPQTAVSMEDLALEDGFLRRNDEPFSGLAYELYPEGTLYRAAQYKDGKLNGMTFLWYPDGSPQMSAGYKAGALHGRFQGWYPNGSVIYDMFINRGAYGLDLLSDEDQSRRREEQETYEQEGNTDDGTRE